MDYRAFITEQLRQTAKMAMDYFGKVSVSVKPNDTDCYTSLPDVLAVKS